MTEREYDIREANRLIESLCDFAETYPDLWEIIREDNKAEFAAFKRFLEGEKS